jgi:hypothetical protein
MLSLNVPETKVPKSYIPSLNGQFSNHTNSGTVGEHLPLPFQMLHCVYVYVFFIELRMQPCVGLIICLFYKFQTPEVMFESFRKDL